jgi:hypothetical protein
LPSLVSRAAHHSSPSPSPPSFLCRLPSLLALLPLAPSGARAWCGLAGALLGLAGAVVLCLPLAPSGARAWGVRCWGPLGPARAAVWAWAVGPLGAFFAVWALADMSGWQLSFSGLKVQTRLGNHKGLGDTGAGAHGHGSCPPLPKPNISDKQGSSPIIGGDRHITS